eukprot:m.42347 g.42347  ORF g.42347 m.42347 type:complete len:73 (-) comp14329_c0_seq1:38-256(-)
MMLLCSSSFFLMTFFNIVIKFTTKLNLGFGANEFVQFRYTIFFFISLLSKILSVNSYFPLSVVARKAEDGVF